ncbi:MAG: hypothetical protein ACYDBS_11175, partial [Acidimicrobiales bacterium]
MSVEVERTYEALASSPAAARAFVSEILQVSGWVGSDEVACLLTSELVANAVIHTGTDVTVRMNL